MASKRCRQAALPQTWKLLSRSRSPSQMPGCPHGRNHNSAHEEHHKTRGYKPMHTCMHMTWVRLQLERLVFIRITPVTFVGSISFASCGFLYASRLNRPGFQENCHGNLHSRESYVGDAQVFRHCNSLHIVHDDCCC